MFRKENGVTLVALVITIIVLLILAGVTISMVLGNDGILTQASGATESYTLSDIKEKAAIAAATLTTRFLADKYDSEVSHKIADKNNLTAKNFTDEFAALLDNETDPVKTDSGCKVNVLGVEYTITLDIDDNYGMSVESVVATATK